MNQVIGLILLIAAISVALYVGTNYDQISGFRIDNLPSLRAVDYVPSLSLSEYEGDRQEPVIETASAPVAVSYIKPQTASEYGELALSASGNIPDGGVDIKGWKIGSLESIFTLPGAQEVYTFGGSQNSLVIRPGDNVRIFSGSGPRGNFRINKCIGYIARFANFNPPPEQRCPNQSDNEISYLSNACKSYINSLPTCETPSAAPVSFNDISCHEYLNTMTYEGCVSRHRSDSDFLEREIWIWAGDGLKYFDQGGDLIRIFDKTGKTVSQYRY